ncbi:hypothetical protein X777_06287 [Ooceraea biroi]|uniref:Uncharacterized protein n=1 Tax=Ooceraea biroi TaxID=2015173 RepID=A0A026WB91_OOCBI|nr:hypothetical protein X777_06287 [Ooceraea biroi]
MGRSALSNLASTLPALPFANRRSAGERFKRSQLRPLLRIRCASLVHRRGTSLCDALVSIFRFT